MLRDLAKTKYFQIKFYRKGSYDEPFSYFTIKTDTLSTDLETYDSLIKQYKNNNKTNKNSIMDLPEIGPIYPFDTFIVNLLNGNHLKCQIDLELDSPDLQQEVDKKLLTIRDTITKILSSKTIKEIQTPKGKKKLKEEIKRKINKILTTGKIKNVYFTQFEIY